jgi:biopolymer transport protein ExbB/biopolymer transport protein TolQ
MLLIVSLAILAGCVLAGALLARKAYNKSRVENQYPILDSVKCASARAASLVHIKMKRGIDSVATIAATAPLLGFLGTTVGILTGMKGTAGDPDDIRRAILADLSEALVPAVLGLFVALLALSLYRYLSARLEGVDIEMQNASLELLNRLSRFPRSTNI